MADPLFVDETKSKKCLEIKRYGFNLVLEVSEDGVECHGSYVPLPTGGAPITGDDLKNFLAQFKISEGILPEALESFLKDAANGKAVSDVILARGTVSMPGKDGQLVLEIADELASIEVPVDKNEKNEKIDLRNVQTFLNTGADQLIATIIPPGPGVPGKNVFGKEIPPVSGMPIVLAAGLNVRRGGDGQSFYSEAAGRVCVRDDVISVEDVYEVDGDVDFKVGNILFRGFVEIKGDVLDDFIVKTTKGIKVHGIIGACRIESDGDIYFSGMNGQGTGTVRCGGTVSANYIYDTSVEAAGDVKVDLEIRNAHIRTLGAIHVNKGGIAGGEYFALAGIETANLGNVSSQHTRVVAGAHYSDLEELNRLFNELKQLIAHFNSAPKGTVDLKEFGQKRAAITAQTQEVRLRTYEKCNPKVNVRKVLYEGANITLGSLSETITEERKGPISVIENTIEGGFRYLGMTDLSFKASAIEQTFIQQQENEQK